MSTPADPIMSQAASGEPVSQDATPDVSTLMAQLKKLEQEKSKLIAENVEKKNRERATAEQAAKLAAEQGDYKLALDQERSRREELEKLAPLAERWKQFEAAESQRITAERETLSPAQQRALDAVESVDAKRAVLDAFRESGPALTKQKSPAPAHGGGSPSPGLRVDFADVFSSPEKLADAKQRDPEGYRAYVMANGGFSKPASFSKR